MKKIITAGIAAIVIFMLPVMQQLAVSAGAEAKLTKVQGDVKVKSAPEAEWDVAKEGVKVGEGAAVKCGPDSQVFISWSDHAVKVAALSTVKVETLKSEADGKMQARLNLEEGKVFAKVAKLGGGSTFEVRTPTAIAGVRGTGFEAETNRFAVVEGSVSVNAGGAEVQVEPGMMVEIWADGTLGVPAIIPDDIMQNMKASMEECKAVSAEASSAGGTQGKSEEKKEAKQEQKEAAKEETKQEAAPAAPVNVDEAVSDVTDKVVEQTTNIMPTVESNLDSVFQPGHGGLTGTFDIDISGN